MSTQPEPHTAKTEPMPAWWTSLHMRAADATLPDQDLVDCLAYIDKLRRERDRLFTQLCNERSARTAPAAVLLDRVEAVLAYLSARLGDDISTETAALISEVTGRISGRVS